MRLPSLAASFATLLLMTAVAVPNVGCPGDEDTCSDYSPPASFDPSAPVVSFKDEVLPIFGFSCAFSTCHGTQSGSANGIYLGGSDAAVVRTGLVDQPAPQLPAMAFVKPGDPRNSYLMRKLDGSQCVLNAQCINGDCGDSMPRQEEKLPLADRDKIRRWIAQGALDN